jgi:hypothetical protein
MDKGRSKGIQARGTILDGHRGRCDLDVEDLDRVVSVELAVQHFLRLVGA